MKYNKLLLTLSLATLIATSAQAGYAFDKKVGATDTKLKIFGFAQVEMRGGEGVLDSEKTDAPITFSAQRIRWGMKYSAGNLRAKILVDFNKNGTLNANKGVPIPDMVKDVFIAYKFNNTAVVKAGVFKSPVGMSWTMPGWNLDNVERAFDKALVLERTMGLMLSGRGIGFDGNKVDGFEVGHERPWKGFGYDLMLSNQASRSQAVLKGSTTKGGGISYAVRAMYDYTELLHIEASYGKSQNAAGYFPADVDSAKNVDYRLMNMALDSNVDALSLKAEYFNAINIQGNKSWKEQVTTANLGYFVTPSLELVVKHVQGRSEKSNVKTSLGNTYLGMNLFLAQAKTDFSRKSKRLRNKHRVTANYIVASGDKEKWNGLNGYKDNAFVMMYQFIF